ncbi:hypothetical protein AOLI_G00174760 [Acnodon oligacanthus]
MGGSVACNREQMAGSTGVLDRSPRRGEDVQENAVILDFKINIWPITPWQWTALTELDDKIGLVLLLREKVLLDSFPYCSIEKQRTSTLPLTFYHQNTTAALEELQILCSTRSRGPSPPPLLLRAICHPATPEERSRVTFSPFQRHLATNKYIKSHPAAA